MPIWIVHAHRRRALVVTDSASLFWYIVCVFDIFFRREFVFCYSSCVSVSISVSLLSVALIPCSRHVAFLECLNILRFTSCMCQFILFMIIQFIWNIWPMIIFCSLFSFWLLNVNLQCQIGARVLFLLKSLIRSIIDFEIDSGDFVRFFRCFLLLMHICIFCVVNIHKYLLHCIRTTNSFFCVMI